jgi:hypothetical protein
VRKRRVACHTPTLAARGVTLCAATNGTPSTDNTTSRTHTGARGARPSAAISSAHGSATHSRVTRTATAPSARRCAVSEPPRVNQSFWAALKPGKGATRQWASAASKRIGMVSDYNGAAIRRFSARTSLAARCSRDNNADTEAPQPDRQFRIPLIPPISDAR